MNISYENIIISTIYFLAGSYLLLTGIFALAKKNIKFPGFYRLGSFMSRNVVGEERSTRFENDMMDRQKVIRFAVFWILIGLIALAGGIFVLFAT
jgi:hypothetical protein